MSGELRGGKLVEKLLADGIGECGARKVSAASRGTAGTDTTAYIDLAQLAGKARLKVRTTEG